MDEDRRVLFLQHQDDGGPGYLGDRARELGLTVEVADLARGAQLQNPDRLALVVSLGSDESVLDPAIPWLGDERAFLEEAVAVGIPVLGVCFGAQLLATVLGARVRPLDRPEIGWLPVTTVAPDLVERGPWLVWHLDTFECPPDAEQLASSQDAVQAYRQGPHVGVQFHPEATPSSVAAWAAKYGQALTRAGTERSALLAETERRREETRAKAYALFDKMVNGVFRDATGTILAS